MSGATEALRCIPQRREYRAAEQPSGECTTYFAAESAPSALCCDAVGKGRPRTCRRRDADFITHAGAVGLPKRLHSIFEPDLGIEIRERRGSGMGPCSIADLKCRRASEAGGRECASEPHRHTLRRQACPVDAPTPKTCAGQQRRRGAEASTTSRSRSRNSGGDKKDANHQQALHLPRSGQRVSPAKSNGAVPVASVVINRLSSSRSLLVRRG